MTVTNTFIEKLRKQAKTEAKESSVSYSQLLEKYAREGGFRNWKDLLAHKAADPHNSNLLLPQFREKLLDPAARKNFKQTMIIGQQNKLSVCYAAFEYINYAARVVLVGLTPGEQQALRANETVAKQLAAGVSDHEALKTAKVFASFSGPMRPNLVALLDYIGLADKLGIASTDQLFGERSDLCHFTSALRYPVFIEDKNYSGSPSVLKHSLLKKIVDDHLAPELSDFGDRAWFVPLGKESSSVLSYLAEKGIIPEARILTGLPHPSGANAERIAYFLEKKSREALSGKTNADALDKAKRQLLKKMGKDTIMEKGNEDSAKTDSASERPEAPGAKVRAAGIEGSKDKIMPLQFESKITGLAESIGMTVVDGSSARHEIEIRFKVRGREESLYINRRSYWRKDMLKLALRPNLSESVSERILNAGCAVPLIQKGDQREAYSSNYRAFKNRPMAKGSKNEHFGHAWLVDINGDLSKLRQVLETLVLQN